MYLRFISATVGLTSLTPLHSSVVTCILQQLLRSHVGGSEFDHPSPRLFMWSAVNACHPPTILCNPTSFPLRLCEQDDGHSTDRPMRHLCLSSDIM